MDREHDTPFLPNVRLKLRQLEFVSRRTATPKNAHSGDHVPSTSHRQSQLPARGAATLRLERSVRPCVRSARFTRPLIASPIKFSDRLTGFPITWHRGGPHLQRLLLVGSSLRCPARPNQGRRVQLNSVQVEQLSAHLLCHDQTVACGQRGGCVGAALCRSRSVSSRAVLELAGDIVGLARVLYHQRF